MDFDVIIIGGGMGGLSCAAFLVSSGLKTLILEKRRTLGGCCTSFIKKGFTFDWSVQSIGECHKDGIIGRILSKLEVFDDIKFIPVEPARLYHFPDFTFEQSSHLDIHIEKLCQFFPKEKKSIKKVYYYFQEIYKEITRMGDKKNLKEFRFDKLFPYCYQYHSTTLKAFLDSIIYDNRLKSLISARSSYVLLPPEEASLIGMAALEMSYFSGGTFVVKGKVEDLPLLIAKGIRNKGGEIWLKSKAEKVIVENNQVKGVIVNNQFISSKVVVIAKDVLTGLLKLVGEKKFPLRYIKRLKNMIPSLSYFITYLGIEGNIPFTSSNQEFFSSYNLKKEYDNIKKGVFDPNASFYLMAPSLLNQSHAPSGYSTVCLSYKAPYQILHGWEKSKRYILADHLIKKAKKVIPNIEKRIKVKWISTPKTIFKITGGTMGAAYGWAQIPRQAGINRLGNTTPIENLYICGHWSRPGGGLAAVAHSGELTYKAIINSSL